MALVDTSMMPTPDRTALSSHSNLRRRPTAEGYFGAVLQKETWTV